MLSPNPMPPIPTRGPGGLPSQANPNAPAYGLYGTMPGQGQPGALPDQANAAAPAYGLYGQRPMRPTNQSVHDALLEQLGVGQG